MNTFKLFLAHCVLFEHPVNYKQFKDNKELQVKTLQNLHLLNLTHS